MSEAGFLHAVIDLTEDDPPIQQLFKAPIFSAFWQVRARGAPRPHCPIFLHITAFLHIIHTLQYPLTALHNLRVSWLVQGRLIPGARIDSLPFIEVHLLSILYYLLLAGTTKEKWFPVCYATQPQLASVSQNLHLRCCRGST